MCLKLAFQSLILFCLLTVGLAGFAILADYSSRPGPESDVLTSIVNDDIPGTQFPTNESSTIILFYHPKCPCTFATIRCLESLATIFRSETKIHAFAYRPKCESDLWIDSRSTHALKSLSDVCIHTDIDGEVCRRFGVKVSGHILVYDRNGYLSFSGGITPFRGHEGDSRASSEFVRCVNGDSGECTRWPVFGCEVNEIAEESLK